MKKLAIITTHPIQYNAPWFALLTQRGKVDVRIFYTWPQAVEGFDDPDFGTKIKWDIPLLEGYQYRFVKNISQNPSSKSYKGIDNPTLVQEVKNYKPNSILVFGWKFKSHFALMRHFKGKVPIWFRGDSTLLDYDIQSLKDIPKPSNTQILSSSIKQFIKFKIRTTLLKIVYRYVDKAFYVGSNSKKYFEKHGLKEKQLVLAPHAIENERFFDDNNKQYEIKAGEWRSELGIPPSDKAVLFAGKLESKKNPLLLLKAIQQLNNESPTTHLIFAGSGPLEDKLKQQAHNDTNIHFLPFQNQSQMPVVYRLGNIFCLPSQGPEETWGLGVNEALASGRPVLVSDKVGCAIDVVNDQVGKVFKNNDTEDLQIKLRELLKQDILPQACQQHIKSWSFEAICKSIEGEMGRV